MTNCITVNGNYEYISCLEDVIRLLHDDDKYSELADILPDLIREKLEDEQAASEQYKKDAENTKDRYYNAVYTMQNGLTLIQDQSEEALQYIDWNLSNLFDKDIQYCVDHLSKIFDSIKTTATDTYSVVDDD